MRIAPLGMVSMLMLGVLNLSSPAYAEDARDVTFSLTQTVFQTVDPIYKNGDTCNFTTTRRIHATDASRIIVRNASDVIIAVTDIGDGVLEIADKEMMGECSEQVTATIESSPFYSLWVDAEYVTTVRAEELDQPVKIDFSNASAT